MSNRQFDPDAYGDPPRSVSRSPLILLVLILAAFVLFMQVRSFGLRSRGVPRQAQGPNGTTNGGDNQGGSISIEPYEGWKENRQPESVRSDRGDWAIEEVDSKPSGSGGALEGVTTDKRLNPRDPEEKRSQRGDWVIEEVDSTNPNRPSKPKSTEKGDWSIEEVSP